LMGWTKTYQQKRPFLVRFSILWRILMGWTGVSSLTCTLYAVSFSILWRILMGWTFICGIGWQIQATVSVFSDESWWGEPGVEIADLRKQASFSILWRILMGWTLLQSKWTCGHGHVSVFSDESWWGEPLPILPCHNWWQYVSVFSDESWWGERWYAFFSQYAANLFQYSLTNLDGVNATRRRFRRFGIQFQYSLTNLDGVNYHKEAAAPSWGLFQYSLTNLDGVNRIIVLGDTIIIARFSILWRILMGWTL